MSSDAINNAAPVSFQVVDSIPHGSTSQGVVYLVVDNWNDWFKWMTMYNLVVVDDEAVKHHIGSVKIGSVDMEPGRTPLPETFEQLPDEFFSLGQDEDYYHSLHELEHRYREAIIDGLHDIVADARLFQKVRNETVTQVSLMRSVSDEKIKRFRRMLDGDASLTPFRFNFSMPQSEVRLHFEVTPDSQPPTNVHVLIGRNGVGKTRCLQQMSISLLSGNRYAAELGSFSNESDLGILGVVDDIQSQFNNLVSVAFSAFDPFQPLSTNDPAHPLSLRYDYVGLGKKAMSVAEAIHILRQPKQRDPQAETSSALEEAIRRAPSQGAASYNDREEDTSFTTKGFNDLTRDFVRSVKKCQTESKRKRWKRALLLLQSDPLFKDAQVTSLANLEDSTEIANTAHYLFRHLSSGHKIVLLTITRLIETVDEKTLVLLDEPEAHLHPPLLSAFVRALSDLLIQRNGVAIIATHSPVILQEVPSQCVWTLHRSGHEVSALRPELETFGENVGMLTRQVFGLEVGHSGFHSMLESLVNDSSITRRTYSDILEIFQNKLGAEARMVLRALISQRDLYRE